MAVSARPVASERAPEAPAWPWHTALVGSVRVSLMASAQRRMEAETYLTDGHGIRLAIESKSGEWVRFAEVATASAPPRIKQILVSPEAGVPYLNTSQVFDLRPRPRKWLALSKTTKAEERLVKEGAILVMASATVGRAIVATKAHENAIVSHHFMRVVPKRAAMAGWVYAFLRSPQALAMMKGSQYASVIRHIEPHHLHTLPVPEVSEQVAQEFNRRSAEIVALRNDASRLRDAAEQAFQNAVGPIAITASEEGFSVQLGAASVGRRRLEAAYHAPIVAGILSRFQRWEALGDITQRVWWGKRFKRHYGEAGIPYLSADDVFTRNLYSPTRIVVTPDDGHEDFFVKRGWLLMACSGQVYGLNGAVTLATEWHENTFMSHDLIRIEPKKGGVRAGYLLTALTHPALGRPLLIREAYGMSIPHLDPGDVAAFPVVRFDKRTEDKIADLAEEAGMKQAKAEALERELSQSAERVVAAFLLRPVYGGSADIELAARLLEEIDAHPERVLRGSALEEKMKQWES